ncbi:MAG: ion channel [Pseudomonadota bacterium]
MTTLDQILLGTVLLIICSLLHVVVLVWSVDVLQKFGHRFSELATARHQGLLIGALFATVVFSHTLQVWIWAIAFVVLGAIDGLSQSIYFALTSYTTLGYGDVTLGPAFRVFGAMSAVTGLLTFGLSTAFLAGLLARLLPRSED